MISSILRVKSRLSIRGNNLSSLLKIDDSSFKYSIFLALFLVVSILKYFLFIQVFLTIHQVIQEIIGFNQNCNLFLFSFFISLKSQKTLSSHFCLTLQVFKITKSAFL